MMFNEAQTRHLLATFKEIDSIFENALRGVGKADDQRLFQEYLPDATGDQKAALGVHVARFRAEIRYFLEREQIAIPAPSMSSIFAFQLSLQFVGIALDESRPQGLRNFGAMSSEGSAHILRLIDDLKILVAGMIEICGASQGNPTSEERVRDERTRRFE